MSRFPIIIILTLLSNRKGKNGEWKLLLPCLEELKKGRRTFLIHNRCSILNNQKSTLSHTGSNNDYHMFTSTVERKQNPVFNRGDMKRRRK